MRWFDDDPEVGEAAAASSADIVHSPLASFAISPFHMRADNAATLVNERANFKAECDRLRDEQGGFVLAHGQGSHSSRAAAAPKLGCIVEAAAERLKEQGAFKGDLDGRLNTLPL